MKYVFYEKDELEKDLIVNVLKKYCVPFKIDSHEHGWRDELYDISIDLNPDKIEWVKAKISERITLENCYLADTQEHPTELKKRRISATSISTHCKAPSVEGFLNDIMCNSSIPFILDKSLKKHFPKDNVKQKIKNVVSNFIHDLTVGRLEAGEKIHFHDLPKELKQKLLNNFSVTTLLDKFTYTRTADGSIVVTMVEE